MTSTTLAIRPEARFEPVDDGLLVLTHRGDALLEGAGLKPWVDAIRPLLDGTRDRAGIVDRLPADQGPRVGLLVDRLVALGAVREIDPSEEPSAPASDEERFLAYFRPGARAAHEQLVRTRVVIAGDGELGPALVEACRTSGLRDVTQAGPTELDRADLVLHVLGSREDRSAGDVARWCSEQRVRLVQLLHEDGGTWFSTPERRDDVVPGLFPVLPRLDSADGPRTTGTDGTAVRIVAARVVHEAMRWICGVADPPSRRPGVVRVDDELLTSATHRVVPYVLDAAPAGADRPTEVVDPEQFALAAGQVMDSRTGLFDEVVEGALSQLPLNRSRTSARLVTGAGVRRVEVQGVGVGFEQARRAVALRALGLYAASAVDPRRLARRDGDLWLRDGDDPEAALRRLREAPSGGESEAPQVAAVDALTGEPCLVAVREAFALDGLAEPVTGVAAALSGSEAREAAVAERVEAALVAHLRDRTAQVVPLVLDEDSDGRLPYLVAMLGALDEPTDPVEVRGPGGLRAVGLRHGDAVTALAWRTRPVDALVEAMVRRLASFQEHLDLWPDGSPPPVAVAPAPADPEPRPLVDVPEVSAEAALAQLGGRWCWVALDHDPAVVAVTPHVVRLVGEARDA